MSDDNNATVLQYLESIERKIDSLRDDLSPRVRTVEAWQNDAGGKITVITMVGVMVGGVITWIANKLFA